MIITTYIILSVLFPATMLIFRNKAVNYTVTSIFAVIQWLFTIYEFLKPNLTQGIYFNSDSIGLIFLSVTSIIGTFSLFYSHIYLEKRNDSSKSGSIYYSAFIVLIASLTCICLANHPAIAWIFVELTTLSSSILIYHRRTDKALEAAWKYIFICSVSVALIFMGILFLGLAMKDAGSGDLFYSNMFKNAALLDEFWLKTAFLFIFTGYTVKAGLVPMYTAGIDAKDKAPSPASAVFSTAVLNIGFLGIFRIYEVVAKTNIIRWAGMVMFVSAILSIFIAAGFILKTKNLKRIFAYSSVEHMGLATLGLAVGGAGIYGAILHLILHSFIKSGLYYQAGSVYRVYQSDNIDEISNYYEKNLPGALSLIIGFFLVTAIPPSGMFISEFIIFRSLFENGYLLIIILTGLLLTFIIWSMGSNLFSLLFSKAEGNKSAGQEKITLYESLPQFALFMGMVYLGFNTPKFLVDLINSAIKNFQ